MNSRDNHNNSNSNRNRSSNTGHGSRSASNSRSNYVGRNTNSRGFSREQIQTNKNVSLPVQSSQTLPLANVSAYVHPSIPITNFPGLSPRDQEDLESFRIALRELTFNSRPVIEILTGMAKERSRNIAGPVSRTILDNLVFVRIIN